jgi:hypothetical protein
LEPLDARALGDCTEFNAADVLGCDYWSGVSRLAMQGRLSEVWLLLSIHSEIAQAVREGGAPRLACEALYELLHTHPYAAYLGPHGQDIPPSANLFSELERWRLRVAQVRSSPQHRAFFSTLPELEALFSIFSASGQPGAGAGADDA